MKTARSIFLVLSFFALESSPEAAIIHVPDDQNSIQAGIDIAESGDTVLVSHGIYRENIVIRERPVILGSLLLLNGDSLEAGSTILEPADSGSVITLIENCGASVIVGFTVRYGTGVLIESEWNEFIAGGGIMALSGEPVVRNCIIRDNRIENWSAVGAGIYAKADSITILNCNILNNSLIDDEDRFTYGSGIYLDDMPSLVESCRIQNNNADGIYCAWGAPVIRQCVIESNGNFGICFHSAQLVLTKTKISQNGIGVYARFYHNSGLIDSCEVNSNSGERYTAGGIDLENGSCTISNSYIHHNGEGGIQTRSMSVEIDNCRVIGNSGYQGAGISLYGCSNYIDGNTAKISNSIITGNRATRGAGLYCNTSSPVVTRTLISGNTASETGGVLVNGNSNTIFINCTIAGNGGTGNNTPPEIDLQGGPHVISNSIVWNANHQILIRHTGERDNNSICVANSCIKNGSNGIAIEGDANFSWLQGNISDDPLTLGDPNRGHLREGSPAIDTGRTRFVWLGDTLFDYSEDEYFGEAPDMGFWESNFNRMEDIEFVPVTPLLVDAWPNPFNSTVTVGWQMPGLGVFRLEAYDLQGKLISRIAEGWHKGGNSRTIWDASNLAAGSYLLKLSTGSFSVNREIVLVK